MPLSHAAPAALSGQAFRLHRRSARPASPFRFILARPEPWWREALRWSLFGLTTSWAAGEITLWLMGL